MKKFLFPLVPVLMFAAQSVQASPATERCDSNVMIEMAALSTTAAVEFSTASANGKTLPSRRQVCIRNLDTTAANHVWLSTFAVSALVSGVLDTSKSYPIPGGNVTDAEECFQWGPAIRFWLHRVIGTAKAVVMSCD